MRLDVVGDACSNDLTFGTLRTAALSAVDGVRVDAIAICCAA
jgi:hypothetical protein